MTHGSLFSGIGGFDLAAEWMGWQNLFHCEYDEFNQKILKYYWPNAKTYKDIKQTDFTIWRGRIDILTGGFPCQPYSQAGKRLGKDDERHLWPEMLRAIREIKPKYLVGENVSGLLTWNDGLVFDELCTDLENEGYQVQTFIIPACAKGAPHRRDRVWIIAYTNESSNFGKSRKYEKKSKEKRLQKRYEIWQFVESGSFWTATNPTKERLQRRNVKKEKRREKQNRRIKKPNSTNNWEQFPTQPPICSGNNGIPTELDGITFPQWRKKSLMAYGNAIVPQIAFEIFKALENLQ